MFGFLKKKCRKPVVYARQEHCISRRNIDPDALKVLYRLSDSGYTAYLVGGGVRDLLLIGRRFRLAHIRFGTKVIETATFRQNSQTVGEIIEHASEGPQEDNTFGTPETDAYRRDFTVNGLFYDIKDYTVIDWVGGMKDLEQKVIRAIGNPAVRFQEDPVRMMRAIKFSSRLGFTIEKRTAAAMKKYHSCILTAALPRVCEEVFRLFPYGHSAEAFRQMYEYGLLGDLVPELAAFIARDGGAKSKTFLYLKGLDDYERMMAKKGFEVSNALRAAVLMTAFFRAERKDGASRRIMEYLTKPLGTPKSTFFTGVVLLESLRRLAQSPTKGKQRFLYNRDFLDALDYARIVARAEKRSEKTLNEWADRYDTKEENEEEEKGTDE